MATIEQLKAQRASALEATASGVPARTSNQFFGVGPITDVVKDEIEGRVNRYDFDRWLEATYRKQNDN